MGVGCGSRWSAAGDQPDQHARPGRAAEASRKVASGNRCFIDGACSRGARAQRGTGVSDPS